MVTIKKLNTGLNTIILDFAGTLKPEHVDQADEIGIYDASNGDIEEAIRIAINVSADKIFIYGAPLAYKDLVYQGSGVLAEILE